METSEKSSVFYPDNKKWLSPSALASWCNSKSGFVKSYFAGEHFKGNASTEAGGKIHVLIENEFIKVINRFQHRELEINIDLCDFGLEGILFKGRPDSFEGDKKIARFVDYKSGKENSWTDQELAADIKMRATAWLVWQVCGEPEQVNASIEYVPTRWNAETHEIEPTGEPSTIAAMYTFESKDLRAFGEFIAKTIKEINAAYIKFLASTDEFVNKEDVNTYSTIMAEIKTKEVEAEEIKARIADQMDFGYKDSISTDVGTFYFTARKTFEYPSDMVFKVGEKIYTLEQAEEIAAKAKMAKTEWEVVNTPKAVSRSLGFKPKK